MLQKRSGRGLSLSDEQLAGHAAADDMDAFEELVRRYEKRLYRFFLGMTARDHDSRDLVQETFVKAYRGLDRFDRRRSWETWLFAIGRRTLVDWFRSRREEPMEPPERIDARDPSSEVSAREEASAVWATARAALPENQYMALWLKYGEDLTVGDIAAVMGLAGTHVRVLLHRARRTLANVLGGRREALNGEGTGAPWPPRLAFATGTVADLDESCEVSS
jgi:RNA polymerase sigma-70 factor (ECF subfamily)